MATYYVAVLDKIFVKRHEHIEYDLEDLCKGECKRDLSMEVVCVTVPTQMNKFDS